MPLLRRADRAAGCPWRGLLALLVAVGLGCAAPEPPAADLAYQRGLNALAEQRHDWARRHFAEVLALEPQRHEARRLAGLAWLQGASQSLSPAVDNLRAYLEIEPDDGESRQQLARCLLQLGEIDAAMAALEPAPETPELRLLQAEVVLDSDPEASLRYLEPLLAEAPPTAGNVGYRALDLASRAHALLAHNDEALAAAEASLAIHPLQDKVLYRLSRLYLRQRRLPEAQAAVLRSQQVAALLDKDSGQTPTERLRLWGQLEEQLDLDNAHVAAQQARLLVDIGDLDEARSAIGALAEPSLDLQLDWAYRLLAQGDGSEGEQLLRRLLDDHPEDRRLHHRWIQRLMQQGALDEARQAIEESLRIAPHLGRFHLALSQLELRQGHRDAALGALHRALELAPWKAEWRQQLMQLHLDAGDRQRARAVFDGAPEAHPALQAFAKLHWPEIEDANP